MQTYLKISELNDFIFCPRSIYMHNIYESFEKVVYQERYQVRGTIAHESIEDKRYSSEKRYIQAMEIYSERYNLVGKIDIFDVQTGILIERKYQIKQIFDGYWFQLYAQKIALEEQGFQVNKLKLHSLKDNKSYFLSIDEEETIRNKFFNLMMEVENLKIESLPVQENVAKCRNCIYKELCRGDV